MASLEMPPPRDYGWGLKTTDSTAFAIERRPNGQFFCVLGHALLRGVTAEMIHWWFLNFPRLRVRLEDVPGWEGQLVPAYLLWHPSDHVDARLSGRLGPGGTAQAGARIHIREAMQVERYGLRFPVDQEVSIFYCAGDGWSMGKRLPLLGTVMCLCIRYRDVPGGVQYHYEVVIGTSLSNAIGRFVNRRIAAQYPPAFFEAWHLHNTIEVGTFENFLPALHAQRDAPELRFARQMDAAPRDAEPQTVHDPELVARRLAAYRATDDPYAVQQAEAPGFP